jgi:enoyl-[acyl-carrier protein] reductase I
MLKGKHGVVFGVANKRSIAFACARAAAEAGARVVVTYQGERLKEGVEALAASLPGECIALPCDVSTDEAIDEAFVAIREHMPHVDFGVHSIAYAPREELDRQYVATTRKGFLAAHEISCYSLTALAQRLAPLMDTGGSLVTMSYLGAERMVPNYNVMGLAKASLEASVRYLAADLGPTGIRVNAISAGPIRTLAASGIGNFQAMLDIAAARSPLRRNVAVNEVANATLFLLSELSSGVTGEILFVDGGFNITAL